MLNFKAFIKAHYGKVGTFGTVFLLYLFCAGVTMEHVGPMAVATLILVAVAWHVCLGMAFLAIVEEFD